MAACDKCSFDYFQVIPEFYNNDAKSLAFLRSHSVLPSEIICPHCSQCNYREDQRVRRCRKSSVIPKTKKQRYCDFSVSDSKGTFLDHSYIASWKVLLFINQFLSHLWDHRTVVSCLNISYPPHYLTKLIIGGGGAPPPPTPARDFLKCSIKLRLRRVT